MFLKSLMRYPQRALEHFGIIRPIVIQTPAAQQSDETPAGRRVIPPSQKSSARWWNDFDASKVRGMSADIVELCHDAGRPELASSFIKGGLGPYEVEQELKKLKTTEAQQKAVTTAQAERLQVLEERATGLTERVEKETFEKAAHLCALVGISGIDPTKQLELAESVIKRGLTAKQAGQEILVAKAADEPEINSRFMPGTQADHEKASWDRVIQKYVDKTKAEGWKY